MGAGYSKWDLGSIGWTFNHFGTTNGLAGGTPMYTVRAQAGDVLKNLMALTTSALSYAPTLPDAMIPSATLGGGRYLRVSGGGRESVRAGL